MVAGRVVAFFGDMPLQHVLCSAHVAISSYACLVLFVVTVCVSNSNVLASFLVVCNMLVGLAVCILVCWIHGLRAVWASLQVFAASFCRSGGARGRWR
jgi:hypothetical protein